MSNVALIIFAGISALGGGAALVAVFTARSTNRKLQAEAQKLQSETEKSDADAANILSTTAVGLLLPMKEQLTEMEHRLAKANQLVADMERQLQAAKARIQELEGQVAALSAELEHVRRGLGGQDRRDSE